MPMDPYDPCPCGSGKKLKFCCIDLVGDMQRVIKLQENNQPHMALQALDGLAETHPGNPWVVTNRAVLLMGDGEFEAAASQLGDLAKAHPDHLTVLALYATAAFRANGFEAAKPVIHRAFQKCIQALPGVLGPIAMGIAGEMFEAGHHMAARQHLTLGMRLVPDSDKQDVFLALLELDGNGDIPYPLRSVHELAEVADSEQIAKEAATAVLFSNIGCWGPAADLFSKLTAKEPENADLWYNMGLCRAWDGDETAAAEALHRAAELYEEFETAVEAETIAQLLDRNVSEDVIKHAESAFRVESVGKLLTLLDEKDRCNKVQLAENDQTVDAPSGFFELLDRPHPDDPSAGTLTPETVPNVLAHFTVFDAKDGKPARAVVFGYEGEQFDTAVALFQEIAGGEVESAEPDEDDEQVEAAIPREVLPLNWEWSFPPKTPGAVHERLEQQKWEQVINEVWPQIPLRALNGKTPEEAVDDGELKVALHAALYVLDAYCDSNNYLPDFGLLRDRLHLESPQPIEVTESLPLNTFSAMQLHRLPLEDLSDTQVHYVLNRALLIHKSDFLYPALKEIVSRPACLGKVDRERIYGSLINLCRMRFRKSEALEWLKRALEWGQTQEDAFEKTLQWKLRELSIRIDDPQDPELNPLLKHLWEYYGTKLPALRERLAGLVEVTGIEAPWDDGSGIVTAGAEAGATAGGVWTPDASSEPEGDEKKLWLPGQ